MNIVITLQVVGLCCLTVGMNHISEQLNEYLLNTTKTGLRCLTADRKGKSDKMEPCV